MWSCDGWLNFVEYLTHREFVKTVVFSFNAYFVDILIKLYGTASLFVCTPYGEFGCDLKHISTSKSSAFVIHCVYICTFFVLVSIHICTMYIIGYTKSVPAKVPLLQIL